MYLSRSEAQKITPTGVLSTSRKLEGNRQFLETWFGVFWTLWSKNTNPSFGFLSEFSFSTKQTWTGTQQLSLTRLGQRTWIWEGLSVDHTMQDLEDANKRAFFYGTSPPEGLLTLRAHLGTWRNGMWWTFLWIQQLTAALWVTVHNLDTLAFKKIYWPVFLVIIVVVTTYSPIAGTYAQLEWILGVLIVFLFIQIDGKVDLPSLLKCSGAGLTCFKRCFWILVLLVWVQGLLLVLYTEGISSFLWSLCLVLPPFVLWFVFFCFYMLCFFKQCPTVSACEVAQIWVTLLSLSSFPSFLLFLWMKGRRRNTLKTTGKLVLCQP